MNLYAKSVATYRAVAKQRDKFEQYLAQVESTIKALKPKIFNPFLMAFDEKYQKFLKGDNSLTDYYELLIKEAAKADISLESFPHLKALTKLKEIEAKIDFKLANEEHQKAILSLSPEDQKELLELHKNTDKLSFKDKDTTKAYFLLLEEKLARRIPKNL